MTSATIEHRFRLFLLSLAGVMFLGTIVELWFGEHMQVPLQYIPFVLCGLGFIAVVAVLLRPLPQTIWGLRVTMVLVVLGGLLGIFEHIEHNIEFALEIQPNATIREVFWDSLSGANPLLAPGILAIVALIAIAATYYHPALGPHSTD